MYMSSAEHMSKLVKRSEFEWLDPSAHPTLLLTDKVFYPKDSTRTSYPSHVSGLFYAGAYLKGESKPVAPLERNHTISRLWSTDIYGPIVFMVGLATLDPVTHEISSDPRNAIVHSMSIAEVQRLHDLFGTKSPASDFWRIAKGVADYNRPLIEFCRPYPVVDSTGAWPYPTWPPKRIAHELCTRIGWKLEHVDADAYDIGERALAVTRQDNMFWTKIKLVPAEGVLAQAAPSDCVPNHGPFRKKSHSQVAASVIFLGDYHSMHLLRTNPDVYYLLQKFDLEDGAGETIDNGDADDLLRTDKLKVEVPFPIKNPLEALWKQYSGVAVIDLFGGGQVLKTIVQEGNGRYLGVSCSIKAWISLTSCNNEEGTSEVRLSMPMDVIVGGIHAFIPIPTLCSMRLGEAALFRLSADIIGNLTPPDLNMKGDAILGIFIPTDAYITSPNTQLIVSTANSNIDERLKHCAACDRDSVALFKMKQFKLALDYYQIGLKELSWKNHDIFAKESNAPHKHIKWTPELEPLKSAFIRNRLGAAACCLYIKSWPHHIASWNCGGSAVEEGTLACNAVLSLESKNFKALRRKALLQINGKNLEEAKKCLDAADECDEAETEGGKKELKSARSALLAAHQREADEKKDFGRRLGVFFS